MVTGLARALDQARKVADTVLYEGYVLYPYRASADKNRIRWQFGVLAPRTFSEADGSERWWCRTECVLAVAPGAEVDVTARFLRVQSRSVEEADAGGSFHPVASIDVGGRFLPSWDEAVEEEVGVTAVAVADVLAAEQVVEIDGAESVQVEALHDRAGRLVGRIGRRRRPVTGRLRVRAEVADTDHPLVRLQVRVENLTDWGAAGAARDEVVRRSLASVHLILAARGAAFVSMIDPPDEAWPAVKACRNEGMWPVLVGGEGRRDVVLSSPITLYDHPEVAPESDGDFCDATEIDEILALRVMTLTDEEKRQARGTDPRAAGIVDRCDAMPPEILERLHGAVRSLRAFDAPEPPSADDATRPA